MWVGGSVGGGWPGPQTHPSPAPAGGTQARAWGCGGGPGVRLCLCVCSQVQSLLRKEAQNREDQATTWGQRLETLKAQTDELQRTVDESARTNSQRNLQGSPPRQGTPPQPWEQVLTSCPSRLPPATPTPLSCVRCQNGRLAAEAYEEGWGGNCMRHKITEGGCGVAV